MFILFFVRGLIFGLAYLIIPPLNEVVVVVLCVCVGWGGGGTLVSLCPAIRPAFPVRSVTQLRRTLYVLFFLSNCFTPK